MNEGDTKQQNIENREHLYTLVSSTVKMFLQHQHTRLLRLYTSLAYTPPMSKHLLHLHISHTHLSSPTHLTNTPPLTYTPLLTYSPPLTYTSPLVYTPTYLDQWQR